LSACTAAAALVVGALVISALAACATPPEPASRLSSARAVAASGGLVLVRLPTSLPMMAAESRSPGRAGQRLTVYVEGDGLAWQTREWPSRDPTPVEPVALKLAAAHGLGPVAWVARPCQYVDAQGTACPTSWWTHKRYSEAAVALVNEAIDLLKARHGARDLVLIGHSGGGTIAAAIAARRDDVAGLVTVASNLDVDHWMNHHGLPPFAERVNPAQAQNAPRQVPQIHFIGGQDKTVPPSTAWSYHAQASPTATARMVEVAAHGHVCCWETAWPALLREHAFDWTW
jgi:pimeloyl-ACP methyl ester carboxylesterase